MFEPNSNWALRAQCVIAAEGTGGNGGGGGGVCLHRGLLCALKLPAYGRSIRTHQRKEGKEKIHFHKKKDPGKVPRTGSGSRSCRLKRASRHL